ncbi:UDP-N-acetylmuramoyl-L-alanyl-D-glutamate--2,6-diaminopimelate ligase [Cytobacillus horneckiae]|uniref:UDP-N-acetylmuramoyl-L-alanyl-D-glutamate--2,6-diaminopimelate ligase n=1 Tax=Cytobacillus horneckiae TaxID=549687 RepID=A0A2N0ZBI9_9BACI|nr:UDP-N-acetylmuramoyl-L-alanyl-D-glutamate--2,6-diaminopimelate ligase [Cytobacillus horneckiae]MBN6887061.1 UDP-N-acetylmuramoyl-L-alanyl-D-glutamate--2,6-diaminopimelate ligase [Cytobacillus horneckiae]MCM3178348.1 UDP-N-acetylmuramoyl-L-alanyl-D-glutamate--2,6-diaminopimelate ligase [Cytobacillus horneckiae]MEC1156912.1 UDP-N-acetylmuramoyl-L-alanyl-D-glutamate--2,6-diaminopimelate ligase [Cytobacillus horneckiae]MED2940062.1 UDP-N-acetylmuramoyl-L-alanyl-D-glutamate--2,6-diaminopimelate l
MKLHTLLQKLQPYLTYNEEDIEITSIENDNRTVEEGSLFVCIKGYTVDGHDFASSAVEKGAVAVIAERQLNLPVPVFVVKNTRRAMALLADAFYGQPSQQLHLIGVTGTNGKTTISHIIDKILADAGKTTGLIGTMYTKIGNQTFEVKNTTPESLTLQRTFKKMKDSGVTSAVMEVSSHSLDEGRVHGCDYDIAVFTNLTQDHLDYHQTMDEYRRAKGLLFAQLGNAFHYDRPKYAILNADDAASYDYEKSTSAYVLSYGIDHDADFRATHIQMTSAGTSFDLITPVGSYSIQMQLIGKFSVYNVLASIAAAFASNIPMESIIHSVEEVKGVSGRFETVDAGQDFSVIVDYSHTPDSLENALKTVKQIAGQRIFTVVGCGGDRDRSKRPIMAKIACEYSTDAIFTSDNPRTEDPDEILKDMEAGVKGQSYKVITDRKEAIEYAVKQAGKGDCILIAGKGHETYQQIGHEIIDFDDRLIAKAAIEER